MSIILSLQNTINPDAVAAMRRVEWINWPTTRPESAWDEPGVDRMQMVGGRTIDVARNPFRLDADGWGLFRACVEDPADNTPRLVFADWIEENRDGDLGVWAHNIRRMVEGGKSWAMAWDSEGIYFSTPTPQRYDFGFRGWARGSAAVVRGGMIEELLCDGDDWSRAGELMTRQWPIRVVRLLSLPTEFVNAGDGVLTAWEAAYTPEGTFNPARRNVPKSFVAQWPKIEFHGPDDRYMAAAAAAQVNGADLRDLMEHAHRERVSDAFAFVLSPAAVNRREAAAVAVRNALEDRILDMGRRSPAMAEYLAKNAEAKLRRIDRKLARVADRAAAANRRRNRESR
jgi:uncharacterized protein (TIGR02996 family)